MDAIRFDALARTLASRRVAARGLVALAAVGVFGRGFAAPPDAAAKKKRKGGFGCTTQDDSCAGGTIRCPDAPSGDCFQRGGKPVCAALSNCTNCAIDSDCEVTFGKGARCLKECATCQAAGFTSVCILPQNKTKG